MTNMALFEKVAARELTAEQAAKLMLDADREAAARRRPTWAPPWMWTAGALVIGIVLVMFGFKRQA